MGLHGGWAAGHLRPRAGPSRAASRPKGIVGSGAALIAVSGLGWDPGLPGCLEAVAAVAVTTRLRAAALRPVAAGVSWSVLPLVAGLFILVEALNRAGALPAISRLLQNCAAMPPLGGELAASFGVAALSNVMNNLPCGLLAASALQAARLAPGIHDAVLIGVDLGPNLSVTGSLATVLWLIALRREGIRMGAWQFLKAGVIVMPPALALATLASSLIAR